MSKMKHLGVEMLISSLNITKALSRSEGPFMDPKPLQGLGLPLALVGQFDG